MRKPGELPEMTVDQLAIQAVLRAIEDAGMRKEDAGGYIFQQGIGGGPSAGAVRNIDITARSVFDDGKSRKLVSVPP